MTERERALRTDFLALSENAQKLYIRLLTRRGPAIRRDKISYTEITDINEAAAVLVAEQFLIINPVLADPDQEIDSDSNTNILETLLSLLTKVELIACVKELCPEMAAQISGKRKPDIQSQIITSVKEARLQSWLYDHHHFYFPLRTEDFELYQLAFFGNLHQSLTEFVVEELGHIKYEPYNLCQETRYFQDRVELEQMQLYSQVSHLLELEHKDMPAETLFALYKELPDPATEHRSLGRRFDKICNLLGRQLERLEEYDLALEVYVGTKTPPARERMCRIWVKQGYLQLAIDQCEHMLARPYNEEEREFAHFFLSKLKPEDWLPQKKLQEQALKLIPRSTLTLPKSDQSVELTVAEALTKNEGDACWHCENLLWNTLFGLTYWQVIFAPVPGAFHNPFQSGPTDLHTPTFLSDRESEFQKVQNLLDDSNALHKHILDNFESKQNIANRFVPWKAIDRELLTIALERVPIEVLKSVFSRLWVDTRSNRSGFPDLIHFPSEGGFKLVEVKGPGDKLQKNQIRWLTYFLDNNIPCQVVDVVWQED